MHGVLKWMSGCVPHKTRERDSGRIKGGEAGGADGVEEETSAKRAGLAQHRREQKEERKSHRHSSFFSTNLSVSAFFPSPVFKPHLDSLFFPFWTPPLVSSQCFSFSFLSRLYMSSSPSSFSFVLFIILYLSSAPSFHFYLFVCELGMRSLPVESRLCRPTERVGVKRRHRYSLPGRWHHIEANGCRETWIYICCHPLIQALMSLVHLNLKG